MTSPPIRGFNCSARSHVLFEGGGALDEHTAEAALHTAARVHIGQDGFTAGEVARTVRDGLAWGRARPRYLSAEYAS